MAASDSGKKIVSLDMEEELYSFLETQAFERGENLNDVIRCMLLESMESWCDYCDALRTLADSDAEVRFHVCVKD